MPDPCHRCMAPCAVWLRAGLCPLTPAQPMVGHTGQGARLRITVPRRCLAPAQGKSLLQAHLGTCTSTDPGCQLRCPSPAGRGTGLPGGIFRNWGSAGRERVCRRSSGAPSALSHPLAAVPVPGWNIPHAAQRCRLRSLRAMSHGTWLVAVPRCCSGLSAALGTGARSSVTPAPPALLEERWPRDPPHPGSECATVPTLCPPCARGC